MLSPCLPVLSQWLQRDVNQNLDAAPRPPKAPKPSQIAVVHAYVNCFICCGTCLCKVFYLLRSSERCRQLI